MSFRLNRTHALVAFLISAFAISGCATTGSDTTASFLIHDLETLELDGSTSDLLGVSNAINPRDGSPYRAYALDLERDQVVRIAAESSDFLPSIALYAPDGTLVGASNQDSYSGNRNSLIRRTSRSGRYLLVVSSFGSGQFGSYDLRAELIQTSGDFSFPGSVTGYLFDGGRSHPETGGAMNVYPLNLDDTTAVDISLTSGEFDGRITIVRRDDQQVLADTSDARGASSILTELPAGSYEIWTSARHAGPDGRYTLRIEEGDIQRSETFEIGQRYHGFLNFSRTSIPSNRRTGEAVPFTVDEPIVLDVVMRSDEFDAYLVLTTASGRAITEDDDSGGSLDARITHPLEPGDYILWATSYRETDGGRYFMDSDIFELSEAGEIELDSDLDGTLTQSDDIYHQRGTYIRYYTLEIESEVEVQIDLTSDDFDAYLVLEDEHGQLLDQNDDAHFGTLDSQIIYRMAPGTYRIGVTTFGSNSFGRFNLEVRPASPGGQDV